MSKVMTLEEAFKLTRDISVYIEKWEKTNPAADPLIERWKEYMKKKAQNIEKSLEDNKVNDQL